MSSGQWRSSFGTPLATYSKSDPGPTQTTTNPEIQNGVGYVGAWVADLLFAGFGRPAYLFTLSWYFLLAGCCTASRRRRSN